MSPSKKINQEIYFWYLPDDAGADHLNAKAALIVASGKAIAYTIMSTDKNLIADNWKDPMTAPPPYIASTYCPMEIEDTGNKKLRDSFVDDKTEPGYVDLVANRRATVAGMKYAQEKNIPAIAKDILATTLNSPLRPPEAPNPPKKQGPKPWGF